VENNGGTGERNAAEVGQFEYALQTQGLLGKDTSEGTERPALMTRTEAIEALKNLRVLAIGKAREAIDMACRDMTDIPALEEGDLFACENPPVGCDCPGCSLARDKYQHNEETSNAPTIDQP
jgi:hypothetical protein